MRRHMPRAAAMRSLAHERGDRLDRMFPASILRGDVDIGGARLGLSIRVTQVALVLLQQRLRGFSMRQDGA